MRIPKVFVSYSHDDINHKKWVLELSTQLRNAGIDAILDQWDLKPGDDIPHFMEKSLSESDRILMICTERYVEKANSGQGGVGYERMIVTSDLMKGINNNKVIPIIRQNSDIKLPIFLTSKMYLNFSEEENYEFNFEDLIREILGKPLFEKPPLGSDPFKHLSKTSPPSKSHDDILELMKVCVEIFNSNTTDYINYGKIISKMSTSRIMLDIIIEKAKNEGLIKQDPDKDLRITPEGKIYALNNKIA